MTIIIAVLFLTGDIIIFNSNKGNDLTVRLTGIYAGKEESVAEKIETPVFLSILLLLIPAISLITISLYKNRKLQLRLNLLLILLIVVLIFFAAIRVFIVLKESGMSLSPGLKLLLPLLMLISAVLSYRSIRKDEEMVKSYDRLR